jgi:hypothetical protein
MDTDQQIKTAVIKNLHKNFSADMRKNREKMKAIAEKINSAKK